MAKGNYRGICQYCGKRLYGKYRVNCETCKKKKKYKKNKGVK